MKREILGRKEINVPLEEVVRNEQTVMLVQKSNDYYALVHKKDFFKSSTNKSNHNSIVDEAVKIYGPFTREVGESILMEYKRQIGNLDPDLYVVKN